MSTTAGNDLVFAVERLESMISEVKVIASEIEKAEETKVEPVTCEDCGETLHSPAFCQGCAEEGATAAVHEAEQNQESPADAIREYAGTKKNLGLITPEQARWLEEVADDLEQAP